MAKYTLYVDVTIKMSTSVEVEASNLAAAKDLIRDHDLAQGLLDQIRSDSSALEDCITRKKVWRYEKESRSMKKSKKDTTIFNVVHSYKAGCTIYPMSSEEKAKTLVEIFRKKWVDDFLSGDDSCEIIPSILDEGYI